MTGYYSVDGLIIDATEDYIEDGSGRSHANKRVLIGDGSISAMAIKAQVASPSDSKRLWLYG